MSKNKRSDYVVSLITGKTEQIKDKHGKVRNIFVPFIENRHLTMPQLLITYPDLSKEQIMVQEGLTAPRVFKRQFLFKKNSKDRRMLKRIKAQHNRALRQAGFDPKIRLNITEPMVLN